MSATFLPLTDYGDVLYMGASLKCMQSSHVFRYFEVRSLKRKSTEGINPLMKYMLKIYDRGLEKKVVTNMVKIFKSNNSQDQQTCVKMKNKWENDLLCSVSPIDWGKMCKNIHYTTNSMYWREYACKVLMRYFKTSQIQSKYKDNITSICWRECRETIANHSGVFWSGKVIREFWQNSLQEISNILCISLNFCPHSSLVGEVPEEIHETDSHLYSIVRAAIMKQITRHWLKNNSLVRAKWNDNENQKTSPCF